MLSLHVSAPRALAAPRLVSCRPPVAQPRLIAKALAAPLGLPEASGPEPLDIEVASGSAYEGQKEAARAVLRYVRGSPNKVRRVLDVIRGRTYEDALGLLEFMPYRACEPILKVLLSAAANAKHNLGLRKAKLVVSECYCDEGPVLKRVRCRAQGRAYKILKKTSHITIKVTESD